MRRFILVAAIFFCFGASAFAASDKQAVIGSKHDLGATGGGAVRSAAQDSCIFCHAPHNVLANVTPLWDHALSSQTYTTYTSSTYNSGPQTPSAGSSRLCLSCHDGTVAVGLTVAQGSITTSGTITATDLLGTNLSSGHPVSMTPVDDGQLVTSLFSTPASTKDAAVNLVAGKIECTTCHDPHVPNNDSVAGMFLTRSNSQGALCLACHDPTRIQPNALSGWSTAKHATATNTVSAAVGVGVYGTVAANACSSCHGSHQNAQGSENLRAAEESACSPCHSGTNVSPAILNVMGVFTRAYTHPTTTVSGVHNAAESLPVNSARHAECADCHNSHAAALQAGSVSAPTLQGTLIGVRGYDASGAQIPATKEYQICFKCHADSTNKVQNGTYAVYGRTATRYPQGTMPATYPVSPPLPADQFNVRLQFTSTIGHNVMGTSIVTTSNTTLRSFMLNANGSNNTNRPMTKTSQIYCTDCHDNDQSREFGGTGPNGPHGSSFQHILGLNLYIEPAAGGSGNSAAGRALCNKCHNLTNLNNIAPHDAHMSYGCTTCHDPHGVIGGTPAANRAMMNFDTAVVSKATANFGYFYLGPGTNQKGCYLRCHGENHNPYYY
jgi:predicted CXXCH cytochrome family protein